MMRPLDEETDGFLLEPSAMHGDISVERSNTARKRTAHDIVAGCLQEASKIWASEGWWDGETVK